MSRGPLVSFLLRAGLAVVFLYAAVSSMLEPTSWLGFLPRFLRDMFPENLLLFGFSAFEVVLGLWLLSGKAVFYSSLVSAAALLGIIVFNLAALPIVFRDIAIFFAALALMAVSRR